MDHTVFMQGMDFFQKNKTFLIAGIGILGAIGVGVFYYYADMIKKEEAAYEVLSHLVHDVEGAYQTPAHWQEVEKGVEIALNQFGSTKVKPYLLALKAQVLIEKGETQEGITLLKEAIVYMSHALSIDKLFLTKIALLNISTGDQVAMQEGLAALESLAYDAKNIHAPYAQYLLAYHYEKHGSLDKAKEIYTKLVALIKEGDEQGFTTPYALMARDRLKNISA